jgi:methionyl aminopeptidase
MMNIAHHSRSFCNRKSLLGIRNGIALFHVDNAGRRRVTAGVVSPKRSIPSNITAPHYALDGNMSHPKPFIPILNHEQEQRLRRACQLAKEVLVFAGKHVKIGQTTDEIDRLVHDEVVRLGAYPSPLNYGGFPKSLCTSVNEIVVHGIPDRKVYIFLFLCNLSLGAFYVQSTT